MWYDTVRVGNAYPATSLFNFISHVFFNKTHVNLAGKVIRGPAEILFTLHNADVIKLGR